MQPGGNRLVATGELQTESNAQGKSTIDRGQAKMVNYSLVQVFSCTQNDCPRKPDLKITGLWVENINCKLCGRYRFLDQVNTSKQLKIFEKRYAFKISKKR